MKIARVDFTGIAYLAALGIGGALVWYVSRNYESLKDTIASAAETTGAALNPNNSDNLVNKAVTSVVETVTGRPTTLGSLIYDWVHPDDGAGLTQTFKPKAVQGSADPAGQNQMADLIAKWQATSAMNKQAAALLETNGDSTLLGNGQVIDTSQNQFVF